MNIGIRYLPAFVFALVMGLMLAACGGDGAPTSTTAPTPVASDTPPALVQAAGTPAADRYEGLQQVISLTGFPQIGFPNAPVSVTVYVNFGDPASIEFYHNTIVPLVDRVRNGEVLLTFVPLAGRGSIANERGAARAALCASEQDSFWRFQDALFTSAQADGDPFADATLTQIAATFALNRALWDECMSSNRPDEILAEAERQVSNNDLFRQVPFVTVNEDASLLDIESLNFTIDRAVQQFNEQLEQALAEGTAEATDEALVLPSTTNDDVPPPLIIGLPTGWEAVGYDTLVLQDVDAIRNVPFAVYRGPVTGGTGNIVLLWGFPNLLLTDALQPTVTPDLWLDGLRLLRLAVVENGCNVGTDLRREYSIGGLAAEGTQFAAVDCPELPDTRGWFAGLRQFNINFIFYVYTDPIEAMDMAQGELQAILDTIRFAAPPTPNPNATPTVGQ